MLSIQPKFAELGQRISALKLREKFSLDRKVQIFCLALSIVGLIAGNLIFSSGTAAAQTAETNSSSGFRPTKEQWDGLKIEMVKTLVFRDEEEADGKIAADGDQTTAVFSPYTGRILKLVAKPGDTVKKGAPLLTIDATEFSQSENDLLTAVANRDTANAQYNIAQVKEQRQYALFDAKAGAKQDWEQSEVDLESAKNTLRSAEIALDAVRSRLRALGHSDAEIDALENAKAVNGATDVAAPISGTVTDRQAQVGQYINSVAGGSTTPLYTLSNLSTVWLNAYVREGSTPEMHVGDEADVHVLAFPDRTFKARLSYVSPTVDTNTHRLTVRAEVENKDGLLKPEMFASFMILTGPPVNAPAVPERAVVYEGSDAHIWVANNDQTIALRNIKVGRIQNGMVEATGGLNAGEKVVTSGALFIDRAAKGE